MGNSSAIFVILIVLSSTQKTTATKKSIAITEVTGYPYVFEDDGYLRGICIDLWRRVAKELGIDYSLKVVEEKQSIPAFKNESVGVVDIIVRRLSAFKMRAYGVSK